MRDTCDLNLTMRKADLPRFAPFVDAQPDEKWWDDDDQMANPDLTTVCVYEANYGWLKQREAAAQAGIPFYGTHGEGGEYGAGGFASLDGEMFDAPLNNEGYMFIAINDELNPVDDIEALRAYVAKRQAVKQLFGINKEDGGNGRSQEEDAPPDQQDGGADVSAGVRPA